MGNASSRVVPALPHNDGKEEARLPAELRGFTPISRLPEVQKHAAQLTDLESRLIRKPSSATALAGLRKGLELMSTSIGAAIAVRMAEDGIVAECDRVVQAGNEHFAGVYETVFKTIVTSEGIAQYEEPCRRLQELAASQTAKQRTRHIAELYCDALHSDHAFQSVIAQLAQSLPSVEFHSTPRRPKKTARMVEKVMLRPTEQGNAEGICDVLRAMAVCSSMDLLSQTLSELATLAEAGTIIIVRVKDRIASPAAGGWRDAMVNFYMSTDPRRHIVELQIAHDSLLVARKGLPGHQVYARVRNASEILESLDLQIGGRLEALRRRRAEERTTAAELLRLGCTPIQLSEAGYARGALGTRARPCCACRQHALAEVTCMRAHAISCDLV